MPPRRAPAHGAPLPSAPGGAAPPRTALSLALCLALAPALALGPAACGDDGAPPAPPPDAGDLDAGPGDGGRPDAGFVDEPIPTAHCPGAPGCADDGDGVLRVGVAVRDITPDLSMADYQTVDRNGDGSFDFGDGDEFFDRNGNGRYDGVWIAGYGLGRGARDVANPQWARSIALRRGDLTIVITSVDVVGYFKDEIDAARRYARELGADIDHLLVSATHVHEARDTVGIWGPNAGETGRSAEYNDFVNRMIAESAKAAVDALAPANVQYAVTRLRDAEGGVNRHVGDARDPNVIDDEVRILRFLRAGTDETIATLVNFGAHPEYTGSTSQSLSSDFAHWLREGVEEGVPAPAPGETDLAGVGGVCVYVQGALGVQIGPGRTSPVDFDGTPLRNREPRTAEVLGVRLAQLVLRALADTSGVVTDDTAALGFRRYETYLKVENTLYQLGGRLGVFSRSLHRFDESRPITRSNTPWVRSEIAVLDVGRAAILTVPGELDPFLWVGGKDGSWTPAGVPVVDTTRPHAPDLARAPDGPYLRDTLLASRADAEYAFVFGLAEDFVGYFVPPFDYVLGDPPYINQAPGAHYEETNSLGPEAWPRLEAQIRALIAWHPPAP
jgi:hypothetical protein